MTTWREGLEHWRAWARENADIEPWEAMCLSEFYEALALHCNNLDDEMPEQWARLLKSQT